MRRRVEYAKLRRERPDDLIHLVSEDLVLEVAKERRKTLLSSNAN